MTYSSQFQVSDKVCARFVSLGRNHLAIVFYKGNGSKRVGSFAAEPPIKQDYLSEKSGAVARDVSLTEAIALAEAE